MNYKMIRTGALFACLTVILGAFGAHKLKELIDEKSLLNWETACRYQMYHAFAILLTGMLFTESNAKFLQWAYRFFLAGIFLFSVSIYVLSVRNLLDYNILWMGPITPIGGLCLIIAWLLLARGIVPKK